MSGQATEGQQQGVKQGDGTQVPTPGTTPPEGGGQAPDITPGTTQDLGDNPEVKKLIDAAVTTERKKLNDGFTDRGRELARLKGVEAKLATVNTELTGYRTAADEAELTAARTNPDLMSVYQRKQALKQTEIALNEREAKVEEREVKIKAEEEGYEAWKTDTNATEIAGRYGIEKSLLVEIAVGSDPANMERLAKTLAEKGIKLPTTPGEGEGGQKPGDKNVPESGIGAGGGALSGQAALRSALDKAKSHPK